VHHGNQASTNHSFSDISIANFVTWFPDTDTNQHVNLNIVGMTHAKTYPDNDQLHVRDGKGLVII
jgi:hypothetical protein